MAGFQTFEPEINRLGEAPFQTEVTARLLMGFVVLDMVNQRLSELEADHPDEVAGLYDTVDALASAIVAKAYQDVA
jgi:hypothetical protein